MIFRPAECGLLFFCLCACAGGPIHVDTAVAAASTIGSGGEGAAGIDPTVTSTVTLTPAPTPIPVDRPLYRIQAAVDTRLSSDGLMTLSVQEEATYTNRSGESIEGLILQFEPARDQGLFEMQNLSWNGAEQTARATVIDGQLRIPLETPLAPGETVALRLEYRRLIAYEKSLIGWNEYQIVLGNWYAFFPPYLDGKGWLAHTPWTTGEYLTFPYADFDISLDIPPDTPYRVAASGIPDEGGTPLHFRFTGRSFAIALTTQMPFHRMAGNVEIIGYAQPQYELEGNFMADTAARAMEIFSERYGEYPHPRLTVLESELPDGMEFDGLVFLNPNLFPYYTGDGSDYLTAITAHETAHQWWYGRVGNDQAIDPWLDEAFATYSELLFYERTYPNLVDWWWWIRVDRYPSTLCVDLPVYQYSDFREYVDAVYLRGAKMLHALRQRMGNSAFEESLRQMQSEEMGAVIAPSDVFRIFHAHSALPLDDIWDAYLCMPPPHA